MHWNADTKIVHIESERQRLALALEFKIFISDSESWMNHIRKRFLEIYQANSQG